MQDVHTALLKMLEKSIKECIKNDDSRALMILRDRYPDLFEIVLQGAAKDLEKAKTKAREMPKDESSRLS